MIGETQEISSLDFMDDVSTSETDSGPAIWGRLTSLHSSYPTIDLKDDEIVMGRNSVCSVRLPDPQRLISGRHCRIYKQDPSSNIILIEDFSSNGTFVNNQLVGKGATRLIKAGDEIMVSKPKGDSPGLRYVFQDLAGKNTKKAEEAEPGGPEAQYDILHALGSGNFATVKMAIHKTTGQRYAIKIIDKKKYLKQTSHRKAKDALMEEVNILRSISHPNIIGIADVFDTEKTFYIVLELVTGGELFDHIVECGYFPEPKAKLLFMQMLDAVHYLHEREIVHRDLKPENILFADKNHDKIKLSDFGLSRVLGEGSIMQTMCGTPQYIAPEILLNNEKQGYGKKVDLWSLGAILYIMICGGPPFDETSPLHMFANQQKECLVKFPGKIWENVSEEVKDLICCMLTVDPISRYDTKQIYKHPWITGQGMAKLKEQRKKEEMLKLKIQEDLQRQKEEEEKKKKEEEEERIRKEVEKRIQEQQLLSSSELSRKRRWENSEEDSNCGSSTETDLSNSQIFKNSTSKSESNSPSENSRKVPTPTSVIMETSPENSRPSMSRKGSSMMDEDDDRDDRPILKRTCSNQSKTSSGTGSKKNSPNGSTHLKHTNSNEKMDEADSDVRPWCQYGAKCYRRNPLHFQEFRHPQEMDIS